MSNITQTKARLGRAQNALAYWAARPDRTRGYAKACYRRCERECTRLQARVIDAERAGL